MLNSCKCCFGMSGPISSRQCAPLELHLCNKWSFKSWMYVALGSYNGITSFLKNVHLYYCQVDYGLVTRGSLVTQPMLQPTPNQTELRLIVSKSFFNVDSKNVSKKFLHRHSWKNLFFSDFLWSHRVGFEKKHIFSGVTVEELFAYIFGIYIKKGFRNHQS